MADPQDGTCKDCPTDASGVGACPDNLLQDILDAGKLTSGYNDGDAVAGMRVEKPRGVGEFFWGEKGRGGRKKQRKRGKEWDGKRTEEGEGWERVVRKGAKGERERGEREMERRKA